MASVKGVNITNIDSTPVEKASASQMHGRLRVAFDSYEASSLASGSDITVARLPAGATVYEVSIVHDALGTGVTLTAGDSDDADRLITSTAAASAGEVTMTDDGAIGGVGHEYSAQTDILITTGGAAATGTIKCAVYYAVD